MKKAVRGGAAATILMFLAVLMLYPFLPAEIPIHWGFEGIDAYGEKIYIFLYPCFLLILNAILAITVRLDPKKKNYQKFIHTYTGLVYLMNIIVWLISTCMILVAFFPSQVDMNVLMRILFGITICFIGNMMPRIRQNYFFGFKTPWAIEDERVWIKTHRFAGRVWFFSGIACCISICLPIPEEIYVWLFLAVILIIPMIYSYYTFIKLNKGERS